MSADGTRKLLVELQDGQRVEAVVIKHEGRNTLCVSSQIGCQMACSFCATGTMGIKGNLMGGEILEQLYHAEGFAHIRNVVFMGEAFQVRGKRGRDYFGACKRKRCSFPVSVRGNWVQNSIARGYL